MINLQKYYLKNVDIKEYQQIIDYINNTFNQNIALPTFEMPDINIYEMVIGAISMFDYLKAYVNYINDNYDISKLPNDERDVIELVIEATLKGLDSDIEKLKYEYSLIWIAVFKKF